ncbi:NAD(P)-dependent oxidoreductase, partial [candidate division WOR-3 bacterium]|nr:NAD(P)-dependent oxidoreductase [candidate division WOR-3 bacterium]
PLNVYGNTKLSGEYFIRAIANKYYILRVSGLYGKNPCRAKGDYNFVELMLKKAKEQDEVRVVNDEFLTPTFTKEVARQISKMLKKMPGYGLYHATAEGSCSWYEFAQAIFEITDTEVNLKEAAPGEFASGVKRPKYSVLENYNLKKAGINIFKHWKKSLEEYIKTR